MSIDLDSLKVFARVAELRSFTEAARQLGMPKARASARVRSLESELGTQLLLRSTRVVRLTPEGELLLKRTPGFLAEADEIGALFQAGRVLRGRVRLALPVVVAVKFVIPRLPELLARHPQLQVEICASDRIAAALREGFDLVLRIGAVAEAGLVGRRIGESRMMNCASPSYLRQYGTPRTLDALRSHLVVHYAADSVPNFEYLDGETYRELPMRSMVTVDNFEAYEAAGIAGLGIVQVPRHGVERHDNTLVEILPEFVARPVPIALLHTHGRSVPRRVRVVMSWLMGVLAPIVSELVPR
ncbi:LysR family transcriptional regulator [Corallococcus sp. bb12-1]|uniref:LysR family transcriptional regulator n=1 Tax=Corallococcus sp. bb12-1 TaxID=2996784 RepID=UPI002271DBF5|nr:LysR family transcriptional regulator [Corallococcus sp. bb12-1]MCY1044992.1 LysR family transcriptional regulator [Corallococcus sp. bb12-1]